MVDLIDRQALLKQFTPHTKEWSKVYLAPTIEAEPVVRCRDCKHYHDFDTHFDCNHVCGMDDVRPDDFCSYGERRENK